MVRLLLLCCLPLLSSAILPKTPPGLDTTKYQVDGTDERVWRCCERNVTVECTATVKKNLKKDLCNAFSDRPIEKEVCHERMECGDRLLQRNPASCGKCNVARDGSFHYVDFCAKDGSSTASVVYSDSECQQIKRTGEDCDGYCDVFDIPFSHGFDYGTCHSEQGHCDALCCHSLGRHRVRWDSVESEAECNKSANCGYSKPTEAEWVTQHFLRMADAKQDVVV